VEVRGLVRIDGRDYPAPGAPVLTDVVGAFTAHGIPGGVTTLRAAGGAVVFETPSTINWDKLTTTAIAAKDLTAWGHLDTMDKLRIDLELRFAVAGADTLLPFVFNQVLADSDGVFTEDRITLDRPFAWGCPPPADPRGCWVLDSLDIHYDLTTGAVDRLGVRAHDQSGSPTDFALRLRRSLQAVMESSKKVDLALMQNVDGAQARDAFTLAMSDGAGNRYTEADLRGSDLVIVVRAYCG
jgi:hypothetical protein